MPRLHGDDLDRDLSLDTNCWNCPQGRSLTKTSRCGRRDDGQFLPQVRPLGHRLLPWCLRWQRHGQERADRSRTASVTPHDATRRAAPPAGRRQGRPAARRRDRVRGSPSWAMTSGGRGTPGQRLARRRAARRPAAPAGRARRRCRPGCRPAGGPTPARRAGSRTAAGCLPAAVRAMPSTSRSVGQFGHGDQPVERRVARGRSTTAGHDEDQPLEPVGLPLEQRAQGAGAHADAERPGGPHVVGHGAQLAGERGVGPGRGLGSAADAPWPRKCRRRAAAGDAGAERPGRRDRAGQAVAEDGARAARAGASGPRWAPSGPSSRDVSGAADGEGHQGP